MIKISLRGIFLSLVLVFSSGVAQAAPGVSTFVMDARTGEVLYARSADRRLAPASLTKMMTLYLAFVELEAGRMSLDQMIRISQNAAREPASKLGLRRGSRIQLVYLIRAAAIQSANDAATAIGEAISGSEAEFAQYMTRTARAMGMKNTQFRNANGLTQSGHYSTARDMALLGRRLFYDFPQYYNLFSRRTAYAGIATVRHTNRRFLNSYEGADGIKTGYTNAAGYNLVASARRGSERIIAVMFGGTSTPQRNARVAELLDLGFSRAPSQATVRPLPRLRLSPNRSSIVAQTSSTGVVPRASRAPRREETMAVLMARNVEEAVQAAAVEAAIRAATNGPPISPGPKFIQPEALMLARVPRAVRRPEFGGSVALAPVEPVEIAPAPVRQTAMGSSGGYGVQVGAFRNRGQAERFLIEVALFDIDSFSDAERSISQETLHGVSMFMARFVGMSPASAERACSRLQARQSDCTVLVPPG